MWRLLKLQSKLIKCCARHDTSFAKAVYHIGFKPEFLQKQSPQLLNGQIAQVAVVKQLFDVVRIVENDLLPILCQFFVVAERKWARSLEF